MLSGTTKLHEQYAASVEGHWSARLLAGVVTAKPRRKADLAALSLLTSVARSIGSNAAAMHCERGLRAARGEEARRDWAAEGHSEGEQCDRERAKMRRHLRVDFITGHGIDVEDATDGTLADGASTAYEGQQDVDDVDILYRQSPASEGRWRPRSRTRIQRRLQWWHVAAGATSWTRQQS